MCTVIYLSDSDLSIRHFKSYRPGLTFPKRVKPVPRACPGAGQRWERILVSRCWRQDEGARRPSHGDAAVELVDLLFEELFELRPLGLQRRREEAVLDGEHLAVDVDVLHLQGGGEDGKRANKKEEGEFNNFGNSSS